MTRFKTLKTGLGLATLLLAAQMPAAADTLAKDWDVKRCINFGNSVDSPTEGEWGWIIRPDHFRTAKAAGFDTIRLPIRFSAYASGPNHTIDPKFLARIDTLIGQALDADLKLIINIHHFEDMMKDPAGQWPKLKSMWEQVGARYAYLPTDKVYFEALNEPNENLSGEAMRIVLKQSLATIRKTNPDRIVIMGGDHWSNIGHMESLPKFDDPNVVLTFHYYDPFPFTHQGASWTGPDGPKERRGWGDEADRAELARNAQIAKAVMAASGRPLFMGEFGAYEKAPYADRVRYLGAVRETFEHAGVSWCTWNFTATFPVYQDGQGWDERQLRALGLK